MSGTYIVSGGASRLGAAIDELRHAVAPVEQSAKGARQRRLAARQRRPQRVDTAVQVCARRAEAERRRRVGHGAGAWQGRLQVEGRQESRAERGA